MSSSASTFVRAGPSRYSAPQFDHCSAETDPLFEKSSIGQTAIIPAQSSSGLQEDEEGDDEHMDLSTLQSFASKVQRYEDEVVADDNDHSSRVKIVIPKRGEKDFEPLAEAVRLQEMMLHRSREALFGALVGVRGSNSKSMSHALLSPSSPYPQVIVTRGHLLDSMGISVRYTIGSSGKIRTFTELLPEEALYLLERGSLQIWYDPSPIDPGNIDPELKVWSEKEVGVCGAVELSVLEAFGIFIGKDDLTWERYQAYSYLKRLGYTVHRSRRVIPSYFLESSTLPKRTTSNNHDPALPPFRTWWKSIPAFISHSLTILTTSFASLFGGVDVFGLHFTRLLYAFNQGNSGSLLPRSRLLDYPSALSHFKLTPSAHVQAEPQSQQNSKPRDSAPNPYLPFWHVWKPASHWSKSTWDKGSHAGLAKQRPEYSVAVVNARDTPPPSIEQLTQVFEQLSEEPRGPVKKSGPQYQHHGSNKTLRLSDAAEPGLVHRLTSMGWILNAPKPQRPLGNPMGSLRNGDKALIVAVNDSGNTGWVRFGRSSFAEAVFS